jgi:hypothetical protein
MNRPFLLALVLFLAVAGIALMGDGNVGANVAQAGHCSCSCGGCYGCDGGCHARRCHGRRHHRRCYGCNGCSGYTACDPCCNPCCDPCCGTNGCEVETPATPEAPAAPAPAASAGSPKAKAGRATAISHRVAVQR